MRNHEGKGDTVWLYGANFGGLFVHESWMSPLQGQPTEWESRAALTTRFGEAAKAKILNTYWNSWATAKDFQLMAAEGMNSVRLPFYYLDFMDDQGNWKLDSAGNKDFSQLDRLVKSASAVGQPPTVSERMIVGW